MPETKKAKAQPGPSVMDAIYHRRSVRDYKADVVDKALLRTLLDAAVHAPTAMHEEPWGFVVIQDKAILNRLSESAKDMVRNEMQDAGSPQAQRVLDLINQTGFDLFYNAGTLVVIYAKVQRSAAMADCYLAAQNLMLAAYAKGLGSCFIGLALTALNTPGWKAEFKVGPEMTAVAPIILGVPANETPATARKAPDILLWK